MKKQMRDPTRVQTMEFNEEDVMYAKMFDSYAKPITLSLKMADMIRESKGRQILYKEAAEYAKEMLEMYRVRQGFNGNTPKQGY
jgi:hypothetical protein